MDLEHTLKRFAGNAALLERFVRKLPDDPTFGQLEEAMAVNHLEDAERAAHTLKGVAANLGFQTLSDISAKLMQALRDKDTDLAQTLLTEVREERVRVLGLIAAIG